jgi:dTDP-glucose 4,6-dehydratase
MTTILMTGGTGFIGSHFMAGKPNCLNLSRADWDFRRPWWNKRELDRPDYFIHFGANVKARQSIGDPRSFLQDNVAGTFNVLELAQQIKPNMFVYISSAEALGGCAEGEYLGIDAPYRPSNPYAASKAAGEILTYTFFRSYRLPAIIVRTQCVWNVNQADQTKAVPIIKGLILNGKPVEIYSKNGVIGSRQWIDVDVFCSRLFELLPKVVAGGIYHIVGPDLDNLQMAKLLADRLKMPLKYRMTEISPTHELRYALKDNTK